MWPCHVKYLESPHQQCLGLSPVVSVTMDTCWRLHTLTGLKMVNTNVKPVMSVAIQQKRQLLMYSVSTWKRYPLLHAVSSISLSQSIDLLLCSVFARCLFIRSFGISQVKRETPWLLCNMYLTKGNEILFINCVFCPQTNLRMSS